MKIRVSVFIVSHLVVSTCFLLVISMLLNNRSSSSHSADSCLRINNEASGAFGDENKGQNEEKGPLDLQACKEIEIVANECPPCEIEVNELEDENVLEGEIMRFVTFNGMLTKDEAVFSESSLLRAHQVNFQVWWLDYIGEQVTGKYTFKQPLVHWSRIYEYPYIHAFLQYVQMENTGTEGKLVAGDLGSGFLYYDHYLASTLENFDIWAMDYGTQHLQGGTSFADLFSLANSKLPHDVHFSSSAIEDLSENFPADFFDVLFSISVLEHDKNLAHNIDHIAQGLASALKPGGFLVITADVNVWEKATPINRVDAGVMVKLFEALGRNGFVELWPNERGDLVKQIEQIPELLHKAPGHYKESFGVSINAFRYLG